MEELKMEVEQEEKEGKKLKKKYVPKEITRVEIDFDQLSAWRNSECDDLPICSFLSVYKACGLEPYFEAQFEKNGNKQMVALDNLQCNFYTLQKLKNFVKENWQTFSLFLKADNSVEWDDRKWPKNTKHYAKNLSKRIQASLFMDFSNYCPGVDEDLPDNVLVYRVFEEEVEADPENTAEE